MSVSFSKDGRFIISGSDDYTLRIWDINSLKEILLFRHEGWVNSVGFSPDGTHVVSGSDDKTVRLWNI